MVCHSFVASPPQDRECVLKQARLLKEALGVTVTEDISDKTVLSFTVSITENIIFTKDVWIKRIIVTEDISDKTVSSFLKLCT